MLAARGLTKDYSQGENTQRVLAGVDLDVARGRFVSIMGPSGSGKSTLLHLLGGLDTPTAGEVVLDGTPLSSMSDDERTVLRRKRIGIVYQFFNLVPVLSTEENVALPAVIAGQGPAAYRARVDTVLELVGLTAERDKLVSQLSGGQQQRAAIGRALFAEPDVLLADEPTGNLDVRNGAAVLDLLTAAQRDLGQTIVMVTHDPAVAGRGDEVLLLRDGAITDRLDLAAARGAKTHDGRRNAVMRWLTKAGEA